MVCSGPPTTVFHGAQDAAENGLARGTSEGWRIDVIMSGAVLRTILAQVESFDGGYSSAADSREFAAFRDSVRDKAQYEVSALEY